LFDVPAEKSKISDAISKRILILGIGNILLRDEGIGVHVVNQLQKYGLPDNVEVIDGGTAGLDILLSQKGVNKLVVVDAIRAGNKPGTIIKFKIQNSKHVPSTSSGQALSGTEGFKIPGAGFSDGQPQISLHQVNLLEALSAAEKMNCVPEEVTVIGVEPAEIDWGLELTEKAAQSIPKVIEQVLEEIGDVIHRE